MAANPKGLFVVNNKTHVHWLDITTGTILATSRTSADPIWRPSVFRDSLFIFCRDRSLLRFQGPGARLIWSVQAPSDWMSQRPFPSADITLAGDTTATLLAYDTATGQLRWSEKIDASPLAVCHHSNALYVATQEGAVLAYECM